MKKFILLSSLLFICLFLSSCKDNELQKEKNQFHLASRERERERERG